MTAPKDPTREALPEPLKVTNLPPDLEALVPEPAMQEDNPLLDLGKMDPYGGKRILFWYTADQVREAILAATERAAQIVESGAPPRKLEGGRIEVGERARNAFAAAIRSGGEGGL